MTPVRDMPMTIRDSSHHRSDGIARWRRISDEIAREIESGILPPSSQLPTEAGFAARFGVNRHTIRRALADLADKGLVRSTQGRGTFVEARTLAYPIGPRTRFSEIVGRAGREAHGELLGSDAVAATGWVADALGLSPGTIVQELATRHRADGTPISTALTWLPLPRFAGLPALYQETGSLTKAFERLGVADYLRRSTRLQGRLATADEAGLLDLALGRPILVVESLNTDRDGRPIQATRSIFAADRVEIVVESESDV